AQGEGRRPEGAGPGGPQGGGMRMGGGSMADMLEKLPVISINDLKVGDTILMSSLPGADPTQLTAIQLVTGAETLLAMAAARPQQGGQGRPQGGVDLNGSFGGMFGGLGGPWSISSDLAVWSSEQPRIANRLFLHWRAFVEY